MFYGWWIVAAGVGIQALLNGLVTQAYGAYIVLLRDEFGWSRTLLSSGFAIAQAESGITGPGQGLLLDRFGPRAVVRVGIGILGAGFMLFSQVHSPMTFLLFFAVMGMGLNLAGYLSLTVAVANWFERRRTIALGLLGVGMSVGGLIVPVTVYALEAVGWRTTAFASGVVVVGLGLPLAQIVRGSPQHYGYEVDGLTTRGPSAVRPAGDAGDFTLVQALATRQFWFISLGHATALLIVGAVTVHLVAHLHHNLSYSLRIAALMLTLMSVSQMLGGVIGGLFGDRFSKRWIATICMFVHAAALLSLAFAASLWIVAMSVFAHGLALGMRQPLMSAIRADYFGRAHFGSILGASQPLTMIGLTGGPVLAGLLADRTGDYEAGFTLLAAIALVGSLFFVLSTPPKR